MNIPLTHVTLECPASLMIVNASGGVAIWQGGSSRLNYAEGAAKLFKIDFRVQFLDPKRFESGMKEDVVDC